MNNDPRSMWPDFEKLRAELAKNLGLPADFVPGPRQPGKIEAKSAEITRRSNRARNARRWHQKCPRLYRHSDWIHPRLATFSSQVAQVLGWQAGAKGLLVTGPSGRGKTRALWALLRRLMCHESRDVAIYRSADFFREMQEQINYGRDESARWVKAMAEVPIIAIDDWGQEAVTSARAEWAQATFFDLLDRRMGEGRPLLITTNLSAREIVNNDSTGGLRGDPLLRRLLDSCDVVRFEAEAQDRAA